MVVLLPEPVTPAKMTSPSEKWHSFSIDGGQPEFREVRDAVVDAPGHQRQLAALLEQRHAEAALVLADDPREIDAALVVEDLPHAAACRMLQQQPLHVLLRQRPHVHAADVAAQPHHRRLADLQVQVGRLVLHDHAEELVDLRLAACSAAAALRVRRLRRGLTVLVDQLGCMCRSWLRSESAVSDRRGHRSSRTGTPRSAR